MVIKVETSGLLKAPPVHDASIVRETSTVRVQAAKVLHVTWTSNTDDEEDALRSVTLRALRREWDEEDSEDDV